MELKAWTYEDMPDYDEVPEGAKMIPTTGDELGNIYLPNVVYAHTPQGDLTLQIFLPLTRNATPARELPFLKDENGSFPEGYFDGNPRYPALVYVQGSAWMRQNVYGNAAMASRMANRGFVVAVVEYRDSARATFPAPILDTMNAVRFLKKNAARYCVDPGKILVTGNSSGGHTAMMAGIWHKEDKGDNLYPEFSAEVCGIINQYGSTDFLFEDSNPSTPEHCSANSPEGMEMGGVDMTQEMKEALTVRTHVTPEADIPPCLIFHGTKDRLVNCKCSVYLYQRLKECGKDAELYLMKGADHGGSEFWTEECLDIMEAFVKRVTAK